MNRALKERKLALANRKGGLIPMETSALTTKQPLCARIVMLYAALRLLFDGIC